MISANRKWIIGGVIFLLLFLGFYWKWHARGKASGEVYAGEPTVILWNTTAQVRQRVATLHWGDQLETVSKSGGMVQVRTLAGIVGWVDARMLLDAAAWQQEARLLAQAKSMPVQAVGRTKVFTNLRIEAGREAPRIYQLPGSVPLAIVGHAVAPAPPAAAGSNPSGANAELPRREDWLFIIVLNKQGEASPAGGGSAGANAAPSGPANLVTGNSPPQNLSEGGAGRAVPPLAGWVLGRFVDLDLPQTVRDYATSAGMHPVAWFVLNHIADPSGEKPQYLVAWVQGGEGQSCDFSLIRVYTWGAARKRYETAYVESDFCGYFPIRAGKQAGTGDPEFRFTALDQNDPRQERVYTMRQTSVRRLRAPAPAKSH
jgi:hypothetical protein